MCNHIWKIVNDVRVCLRCGLTINRFDGSVLFDRKLPGMVKESEEKHEK